MIKLYVVSPDKTISFHRPVFAIGPHGKQVARELQSMEDAKNEAQLLQNRLAQGWTVDIKEESE